MNLETIHHVAIVVSDYEKSKDFYVNKLRFAVLGEYVRPNGDIRLDCQQGASRLEIFWIKDAPAKPEGVTFRGLRHLAFKAVDIEQQVQELAAMGIETDGIRPDPNAPGRVTFFQDPDGLSLELHE